MVPGRGPPPVRCDHPRHHPGHRPAPYAGVATFHPTFAYEALWSLALAVLLIAIERLWHPRPGQLFAAYVAGHAGGAPDGLRTGETTEPQPA